MGTHLRVVSKSYLMKTKMTGFQKSLHFVLWMKLAISLEGLKKTQPNPKSLATFSHTPARIWSRAVRETASS